MGQCGTNPFAVRLGTVSQERCRTFHVFQDLLDRADQIRRQLDPFAAIEAVDRAEDFAHLCIEQRTNEAIVTRDETCHGVKCWHGDERKVFAQGKSLQGRHAHTQARERTRADGDSQGVKVVKG
jgi:hypothetical protein